MEAHFGSVETWLSCIISYLFAGQPQPRLGHFKELWAVVAFFYGNGVLCSLGWQFFHACNGKASLDVAYEFYDRYKIWQLQFRVKTSYGNVP